MNCKNKILSFLLIIALIFQLSSCDYLESLLNEISSESYYDQWIAEQIPIAQPDVKINNSISTFKLEDKYAYNTLDDKEKEIYIKIHEAVLNYYRFIDLRNNDITMNGFLKAFSHYIDDNPESFWVYHWVDRFYVKNNNDYLIGASLQYISKTGYETYAENKSEIVNKISNEELTNLRNEFNNKINEILEIISPSDDDLMKEIKIFNYIAENISYDDDLVNEIGEGNVARPIRQSAYGAAVEQLTVCSGFTKLFQLLCHYSGIECLVRYGTIDDENHIWNVVKINGGYYNVDATAQLLICPEDTFIGYDNFNLTDEQISKTHTARDNTAKGETYKLNYTVPECNSVEYSFSNIFTVKVQHSRFDTDEFKLKIERIYKYNINAVYFRFEQDASKSILDDYFYYNLEQMNNLSSKYFKLDKSYYLFYEDNTACIRAYR